MNAGYIFMQALLTTTYISVIVILSTKDINEAPGTEIETLDWTYVDSRMPSRLSDFTATQTIAPDDEGDLNIAIYLIGGCEDSSLSSSVTNSAGELTCNAVSDATTSFDPHYHKFAMRKQALRKRHRHVAVAVNGDIWVVGGRDENDAIVREVDMYTAARDTWITVGSLGPGLAKSDLTAFARGDDLYLVGGYDQNYHATEHTFKIDTVQSLEQNDLVITVLANLNQKRGRLRSLIFGHYGYIVGGYTHEDSFCDSLATTERYDIKKDEWVFVDSLDEGRGSIGFVKFDGRFFAIGGDKRTGACGTPSSQSIAVEDAEVYDPFQGINAAWHPVEITKDDGRFRFVAFPWPGTQHIYVLGGIIDGPVGCNCYFASDKVIQYSYHVIPQTNQNVLYPLISLATVAFGISMYMVISKHRKHKSSNSSSFNNTEKEEAEEQHEMVDLSSYPLEN
eukprot:CAMPEP_0195512934 /NCGR_PEP_ID=MMETSP0794_2-20130614/4716_1 /TAXON_ID=515487 /ORGANISM="Stephanopyxis turris, Strain CCMP 815" /LENGTH=449 /DNA_ID=CAMNT_0040640831 /DNA_START=143 /DNA_END=1492 /DNA_ORIENTATION=+